MSLQALNLHVPSSHCKCVSRSGPNSGRGAIDVKVYKFLRHPVLITRIASCVPAASSVRVATPAMGKAKTALDKASMKCDAAKQHGYQNNPGTSAMSRSVKGLIAEPVRVLQSKAGLGIGVNGVLSDRLVVISFRVMDVVMVKADHVCPLSLGPANPGLRSLPGTVQA